MIRSGGEGGQADLGVEGSVREGDGKRGRARIPVAAVGDQLELDRLLAIEHCSVLAPAAAGDPDAALRCVGGLAALRIRAIGVDYLDGRLSLAGRDRGILRRCRTC